MPDPVSHLPTLEDLRQALAPAWLWDGMRGRVVWANAAGVAAFECQSLFDLIDRPFDHREPGVARIAELTRSLARATCEDVALTFPSAGLSEAIDCTAHIHTLADGRPGLLVYAKPPRSAQPEILANDKLAADAMSRLPMGLVITRADGAILHSNETAGQLFDMSATPDLGQLLGSRDRADDLLQRLRTAGLVTSVERIAGLYGPRDLRLMLTRTSENPDGPVAILMEDVTERRALEREMLARQVAAIDALPASAVEAASAAPHPEAAPASTLLPAPAAPPAHIVPPINSPPVADSAFERLTRTLEETLRRKTPAAEEAPAPALPPVRDFLSLGEPELPGLALPPIAPELPPDVAAANLVQEPAPPQPEGQIIPFPTQHAPSAAASEQRGNAAGMEAAHPADIPSKTQIANDELHAILDVVSDGIITLDPEGRILGFSAGAEAIFGVGMMEVLGKPFANLINAEYRKTLNDYLQGLKAPGLASIFNDGRELMTTTPQGGQVPLFLTLGVLQSPHSRAAFCAVVRDITQWKRNEHELMMAKENAETASRQKSAFIASVSHELRTPLNSILGFSELMREERFGPLKNDKYRGYINDIHSSGSHLLALINDLLDLSKVEAGKLELNFTAVSLEEATDYAMRMLQEQAAMARVLVRKSIPPKLPRIVADHRTLRQIMLNLIANAIKFTNPGGQVIVSVLNGEKGSLVLRVTDTGVGMTEAQLRQALEPFGRVDTPNRDRQGTGLGLPLTKALVEANRASLALTSSPDKGTMVEVVFPGPRVLAE